MIFLFSIFAKPNILGIVDGTATIHTKKLLSLSALSISLLHSFLPSLLNLFSQPISVSMAQANCILVVYPLCLVANWLLAILFMSCLLLALCIYALDHLPTSYCRLPLTPVLWLTLCIYGEVNIPISGPLATQNVGHKHTGRQWDSKRTLKVW